MPRFAQLGFVREVVIIPFTFALGTGAITVRTKALGFRYELRSASVFVDVAGAGAGATRQLRIRKGSVASGTDVGTVTLTLAGTATVGTEIPITLSTNADLRQFNDADVLTIDYPAGGTLFTAGRGFLELVLFQRAQERN